MCENAKLIQTHFIQNIYISIYIVKISVVVNNPSNRIYIYMILPNLVIKKTITLIHFCN